MVVVVGRGDKQMGKWSITNVYRQSSSLYFFTFYKNNNPEKIITINLEIWDDSVRYIEISCYYDFSFDNQHYSLYLGFYDDGDTSSEFRDYSSYNDVRFSNAAISKKYNYYMLPINKVTINDLGKTPIKFCPDKDGNEGYNYTKEAYKLYFLKEGDTPEDFMDELFKNSANVFKDDIDECVNLCIDKLRESEG